MEQVRSFARVAEPIAQVGDEELHAWAVTAWEMFTGWNAAAAGQHEDDGKDGSMEDADD